MSPLAEEYRRLWEDERLCPEMGPPYPIANPARRLRIHAVADQMTQADRDSLGALYLARANAVLRARTGRLD